MTGFLPCQVVCDTCKHKYVTDDHCQLRSHANDTRLQAVAKKPTNEVAASSLKAAVLLT